LPFFKPCVYDIRLFLCLIVFNNWPNQLVNHISGRAYKISGSFLLLLNYKNRILPLLFLLGDKCLFLEMVVFLQQLENVQCL